MKNKLYLKCPLCNHEKFKKLKFIELESFDFSLLYNTIRLVSCSDCGHVYNQITYEEADSIIAFYKTEHEELSSGSIDKDVMQNRNRNIYNVLEQYSSKSDSILDVGCGHGDFLNYLTQNNYKNLYGFELADHFSDKVKQSCSIDIGNAEKMPYQDNKFDILILDQFLEHVISPNLIMKEVFRVIKNNGIVIIGVPNALEYDRYNMFPLFYFILKEHIQHFDIEHLTMLSNNVGFDIEKTVESVYPMHSMNMPMSNLYMVLKKNNHANNKNINKFNLQEKTLDYITINDNKLFKMRKEVVNSINIGNSIYFWGIGREFFLLYSLLTDNEKYNCKFIDSNIKKQKLQKIKGKNILDGSALDKLNEDNITVVITAVYHTKVIENLLLKKGFTGNIIKIFEEE